MNSVILSTSFCSIKMNSYNSKVTNMNKAKKRMNELGSEQKKSRRKCWIFVIYSWVWLLQIISFNWHYKNKIICCNLFQNTIVMLRRSNRKRANTVGRGDFIAPAAKRVMTPRTNITALQDTATNPISTISPGISTQAIGLPTVSDVSSMASMNTDTIQYQYYQLSIYNR